MTEALHALVDQGWWSLPERHHHVAAEQRLYLLGESVIELRQAMQLLLAGLLDGIDDLRHLGHPAEQWRHRGPVGSSLSWAPAYSHCLP